MTPEHRVTLARLLAAIDAGNSTVAIGLAEYAEPLRSVLAEPAWSAALVEVVAGSPGGWSREQVAALVAYVLIGRDLDAYPEVARIVDGAGAKVTRDAAHLARCGEPEAQAAGGEGWESAEVFAVRYVCDHAMAQCDRHVIVGPVRERDAQLADRIEAIGTSGGDAKDQAYDLRCLVRSLRGLPR